MHGCRKVQAKHTLSTPRAHFEQKLPVLYLPGSREARQKLSLGQTRLTEPLPGDAGERPKASRVP